MSRSLKSFKVIATTPTGEKLTFFVYDVATPVVAESKVRKMTSKALKRTGWVGKTKKTSFLESFPIRVRKVNLNGPLTGERFEQAVKETAALANSNH